MAELTEFELTRQTMALMGLKRTLPAPRCKHCRRKCEWAEPSNRWCYICLHEQRDGLTVERPKAELIGRLKAEDDEPAIELYVRDYRNNEYKVVAQGHPVWDGAILPLEDFEYIERARTKIYLEGVRVN